jgi:hypothetical protein
MSSEKIKFQITDPELIRGIESRLSIALDTSVWFNLTEEVNDQVKRVKMLLIDLVNRGTIFCPLTFSGIAELLKRTYQNALEVAALMDEFSLGVSFASDETIYRKEIERLLLNAIYGEEHFLEKYEVYVPVMGWLGAGGSLDFPQEFPGSSDDRKKFTDSFAEILKSKKISDIVRLFNDLLPLPDVVNQPNYDWKTRWEENQGNKKKLRELEKQAVLTRVIDGIKEETTLESPEQTIVFKLRARDYINSLPKDKDGTCATAVLERMPAHKNMVEVMTFTGFDPNRTDKMNDFYDIQLMIIPMTYASVVVATDRWIRELMKSHGKTLHHRSAKYIGDWSEFENYLSALS